MWIMSSSFLIISLLISKMECLVLIPSALSTTSVPIIHNCTFFARIEDRLVSLGTSRKPRMLARRSAIWLRVIGPSRHMMSTTFRRTRRLLAVIVVSRLLRIYQSPMLPYIDIENNSFPSDSSSLCISSFRTAQVPMRIQLNTKGSNIF